MVKEIVGCHLLITVASQERFNGSLTVESEALQLEMKRMKNPM